MISDGFLPSRSAFFTVLNAKGFAMQEVRRSWTAMRTSAWDANELLDNWQLYVASENQWRVHRHEGLQAVSVDMIGVWRPHLKVWAGKHFHSLAQRALPAVVFGVMVVAGEVKGKQTPLLRRIVRCELQVEKVTFRMQLLCEAKKRLLPEHVMVIDAEFEVSGMQSAGIERFVVRVACNSTTRRNQLPMYKGVGRKAQYGELVRPLERKRKGKKIAASQPDVESHFVHAWPQLVLPQTCIATDALTFSIYVFHDPLYKQALVLATNLCKTNAETVYHSYRNR